MAPNLISVGSGNEMQDVGNTIISQILHGIPTPEKSTSSNLILRRVYNLNFSKSKKVTVGMDVTNQFEVHLFLENASCQLGVLLPTAVFEELVYEPEWVKRVNDFFEKSSQGSEMSKMCGGCEAKCIVLSSGNPAIKFGLDKNNYVMLGASTWSTLQNMKPLIISKVTELTNWAQSPDIKRYFYYILKNLYQCAQKQGYSVFSDQMAACKYLRENLKSFQDITPVAQPWHDFVMELLPF
ncbi:uncharacterized protein LOC113214134 [Frankliniella occidentalis]|uniref:Uncharacterized protein LOC113214134 n=1 Tax=Frankliniella occidentalis TaxID=133901 RepID=A0A9C6X3X7_FRAOC|nr:uncharacterized protein LOC113214134 [Frankliniella occidentalis]